MAHSENPRLASATSSYLRSAAHQPVEWFPWGKEAFEVARRESKPILLDIGAVWCHWCHVMDGESYEDPELARLINERFVAIKVDRDERPDVDARYQRLVSAISGQGGWPLTGFLTPEGRVFYGGTYYPPRDAHGRPSFRRVLEAVAQAFQERRDQVEAQARHIEEHLRSSAPSPDGDRSPEELEGAVASWDDHYDEVHGGWGHAPKFPHPSGLELLLALQARLPKADRRQRIEKVLLGMARGGIRDHVGGGFHRYSVDERWHVPHFEKMLYDNAELLRNYVQAQALLGTDGAAEVARETVRFLDEVLSDRERGGFYGSQDADVAFGDDGDYFTWTPEEVRDAVGDDGIEAVLRFRFGVAERGPMHHNPNKNVLHVAASVEDVAQGLGRSPTDVARDLQEGLRRLRHARARRKPPFVDPILYTNWNAMAIRAYLEYAAVFDDGHVRAFALRTLDRFLDHAFEASRGFRHTLGGDVAGLLDDQAQMLPALVVAHQHTGQARYLDAARAVADLLERDFWDATSGGFLDLAPRIHAREGGAPLAEPVRPLQDAPSPSANGRAIEGLLMLWQTTGEPRFRDLARRALAATVPTAFELGLFGAQILLAFDHAHHEPPRVVVAGPDRAAASVFRDAALRAGGPRVAVITVPSSAPVPPEARAFADGPARQRPGAIVCLGERCLAPVFAPVDLERQLRNGILTPSRAASEPADPEAR